MLSMSYFVYDFLACLYYGLVDLGLVIHHSFAIVGYCGAIFGSNGSIYALSTSFYLP